MTMQDQKYTLALPIQIYDELKIQAEKHNVSIRDIVRQCLKFGLLAIKINEDPNSEIVFRERINTGERSGEPHYEFRDTHVQFIL